VLSLARALSLAPTRAEPPQVPGARPLGLRQPGVQASHGTWHTLNLARSNTPSKKYDVITVCSDGRSKGQLSFVSIHIETLRTKIPVVSTPSGPPHCFPAFRGSAATT
jgi:hypothetical protein